MATSQPNAPPKRKEPGLIGKLFSAWVQLLVWLLISLMLSVLIEWAGMVWFWPEEGAGHAKTVLAMDQQYLNEQLHQQSTHLTRAIVQTTHQVMNALTDQPWLNALIDRVRYQPVPNGSLSTLQYWAQALYQQYREYLQAARYVIQTVVIRIALILFSLPIFAIAALVGSVDGLVERDLRRWGGGRESSHVFNLARRAVLPSFVAACVIYISLPISINPVVVILPFAAILGLSIRVAFERLKKYF